MKKIAVQSVYKRLALKKKLLLLYVILFYFNRYFIKFFLLPPPPAHVQDFHKHPEKILS